MVEQPVVRALPRDESNDEKAEALALVAAAGTHDGVAALSEHALLTLRHGTADSAADDDVADTVAGADSGAERLVLVAGSAIAGYAHLDPAAGGESAAAELVVHPDHRRRGHGRRLLRELRARAGGPLRVWAHGDLPAAAALAAAENFSRVRVLLQLDRPLTGPHAADLPRYEVPAGVRLRAFEPGADEDAWLRINSRAFATHPEQGGWTRTDLLQREREPWFDPAGFFIAERAGEPVGFHWTKVHPDGSGEVYVVGVDPDAQGLGLGRVLTLAGLHHLRDRGRPRVLLYVDESNGAAVRLYESLGFTRYAVDVMYGDHQPR